MMERKSYLPKLLWICFCLLLLLFSACKEEGKIRSYKETVAKKESPPTPSSESDIRIPFWEVPDSWYKVKSPSSIRLGTYKTHRESLCTIVMIPGKAGSFKANTSRWMKQLKIEDTHKNLDLITAKSKEFSTIGKLKGKLIDFTPLTIKGKQSFLISIIDTKNSKMFVKLQGKSENLTKEMGDFINFCRSFRYQRENEG